MEDFAVRGRSRTNRVPQSGGGATGWTSVGTLGLGPSDIPGVPVPEGMQARFWWSIRSGSAFDGNVSAEVSFTTDSGDTTPSFQQSTGKAQAGFYSASGGGYLVPTGDSGVYTFSLDWAGSVISDAVLFVDVVTDGAHILNQGS